MAEITKPDFSNIWASGGSIVAPSAVKIQTGWTAEVPPFQWENAIQNRQDNAIVHLFQKGISEWDAASNYYFTTSGTRSYVQGSDGIIYVAVSDSVGQNPTTDTSDTYWKVAFADNNISAAIQEQKYTGFTTTGTATAQVLTPTPAIPAYSVYQRFNVTFNVASGASPTINVSGRGAKSVKQYDGSGAKVAAVWAAGQISDIVYDGTDWVMLDANASVQSATTTVAGIARFGTPAEQAAGLLATVMANPTGVLALVTAMFPKRSFSSTADFIRIPDQPGGLLIQWVKGTAISLSASGTATQVVSFPTTFGSAPFVMAGTMRTSASSGTPTAAETIGSTTASETTITMVNGANGSGSNFAPIVIAIGN